MLEDGAFRMKVRGLIASNGSGDFRKHLFEQTAVAEQVQATRSMRCAKKFAQFIANPLGADAEDLWRVGLKRCEGGRLDGKSKLGGKAHGPQHAQVVLGKPFRRGTNCANHFRPQVCLAADPIVQLFLHWVVEQTVDGEITPQSIGASITEDDLAWTPAILIIALSPKGSDLKLMVTLHDDHHPEFFSDRDSALKQFFHVVRKRRGNHIVILRLAAEKHITTAAADPESRETSRLQATDDFGGSVAQRALNHN